MTLDEAIAAQEKEIEVPGSKLSEALLKIREAGGFVPGISVKVALYTIKVHWREKERQRELL